MDDLGKQWGISSLLHQILCIISKPSVNLNLSHSPETLNSGQTRRIFVRVTSKFYEWPWKKNTAPLLCCFKFCVSFHRHQWIQTGVTVRKHPIWVKIDGFLSLVTLKLDRWPWKTIRRIFCATSSFMHHLVTIGEFKLKLQSINSQFGSKSTILLAAWPWNLMGDLEKSIGHLS